MFRRKGPSEVEVARENELKIALSQELSAALKSLQKESVASEGVTVYSTDTANCVCNCLEAVFLNGLKANNLKKFANYMGLGQQALSSPGLNFWNFAAKFTHSEVVSQLKHLGQITTEIGICRAWIRVAMNDGLMESYVGAMVADKKTLGYFYHSTAYLRDPEQPEIMKTYIHGLMAFEFKLSYNASVLNEWSYTPLLLAGIIDSNDAPPPIIKPTAPQVKTNTSSNDGKKTKTGSKRDGEEKNSKRRSRNPMEPPKFGEPPQDTYYVTSSDFTSRDVEEFKKLAQDTSSMPQSECSGSSHVSCPDPPNLNLSPAQYLDAKHAAVLSTASTKSAETDNDSTADDNTAIAGQARSPGKVEYKGCSFPELRESSGELLKDLYTIEDSAVDGVETVEGDAEDVADGKHVKSSELEESWEDFFKGPEKKLKVDEKKHVQRMESLDIDMREKTILNSFVEEENPFASEIPHSLAKDPEGGHVQMVDPVSDIICSNDTMKEKAPDTTVPVENSKSCDEKLKSVEEHSINDTMRNSSSESDSKEMDSKLVDKYLDRAKAETRASTGDILTKENLQRLEQELASQTHFVGEKLSGSDVDSMDGQIAYSQPRNKVKKEKHKASADKLKPQLSPPAKQPVTPELSDAMADTVETIRTLENPDYLSKHRFSMPDLAGVPHKRLHNPRQSMPNIVEQEGAADFLSEIYDGMPIDDNEPDDTMGEEEEKAMEGRVSKEPRESLGNSLMLSGRGWSSSFDNETADTLEPLSGPKTSENVPITRPKSESFGTLLQNYTPESSLTARSFDDVLSTLPKQETASPMSQSPSKEAVDSLMDGFEVVPTLDPNDEEESERLVHLSEIATERGLDSQNFQCQGCARALGLIFGKPRVCKYDGGYYCFECHENDEYYIPAVIVHNWDFRKHQVCKKNLEFLKNHEETAYLDIAKVNPRLYDHVTEIQEVKALRTQLVFVKSYLHTCKQSTAEDLRRLVWPREYLYENIDLYSLNDLLQVPSGVLAASIRKVNKFAMKHVYGCRLCSQKGFICELCNSQKVIYAFEVDTTYRCPTCKSVFHKECKTDNRPCPKCQRRQLRQSQHNIPVSMPPSDYDFHVA